MRGNKDLSNVHFHPKNVKNKFEKKTSFKVLDS